MFAILTSSPIMFSRVGAGMEACSREVDGPFFLRRGVLGSEEVFLYLIEEGGADAGYVCARVAARRGAELILHLGEAAAAPNLEMELGAIVSPERVFDARRLMARTAVLPDSARELPAPLPAGLWDTPVRLEDGEPGLAMATIEEPLRNPWLADRLWRGHGVGLWDRHGSGMAEGAKDGAVPIQALMVVTGFIRQSHEPATSGVERDLLLEQGARELLAALAGDRENSPQDRDAEVFP